MKAALRSAWNAARRANGRGGFGFVGIWNEDLSEQVYRRILTPAQRRAVYVTRELRTVRTRGGGVDLERGDGRRVVTAHMPLAEFDRLFGGTGEGW